MAPQLAMLSGPCGWCLRAAKWLPVVFIVAIAVWSYYAYVIQLNLLTIDSILQKTLYLLVYHMLLAMFVWSYWQTIFTEIGHPPRQFRLAALDVEEYEVASSEESRREVLERFVAKQGLPVANRTMTGELRYCEKCCHIKPDRCHHCSMCGKCVLKMDHHCPWVNNCVSFYNYKFFLLFLGYAFLYCVFVAATTLEYLIKFWKSELAGPGKFHILFVFFVSIMFGISLVSLFAYHIFLVLKNRSTIESFRGPIFHANHSWVQDKEGFSLGARNNFLEVFGDERKNWFLPVFTSLGDGVSYPMRRFERLPQHQNTPSPDHHLASVTSATPTRSPATAPTASSSPPSYGSTNTSSLGDGVSYPQRCLDEDMDGLLAVDTSGGRGNNSNGGSGETDGWDNFAAQHHHYTTNDRGDLEEIVVQGNHTNPV